MSEPLEAALIKWPEEVNLRAKKVLNYDWLISEFQRQHSS